jgi:hypothetical protein
MLMQLRLAMSASLRRLAAIAVMLGFCLFGTTLVARAQNAAAPDKAAAFAFGLFGDLGYSAAEEPLLANVLADLDRAALAFVVHIGDLGSPRAGSCTDELRARRLAQFQASANPLIYTPGDNDWTDCHAQQGVPGADPLERLTTLRDVFFTTERSFGRRTVALTRQSSTPQFAKYRENARWDLGGITFLTLHVVGSNNGRGRTGEGDAEFAERNSADLAWLHSGFEHAVRDNSRGIVIAASQHLSRFSAVSRRSEAGTERVHRAAQCIGKGSRGIREARRPGPWRQPLFQGRQALHAASCRQRRGRGREHHAGRTFWFTLPSLGDG